MEWFLPAEMETTQENYEFSKEFVIKDKSLRQVVVHTHSSSPWEQR